MISSKPEYLKKIKKERGKKRKEIKEIKREQESIT